MQILTYAEYTRKIKETYKPQIKSVKKVVGVGPEAASAALPGGWPSQLLCFLCALQLMGPKAGFPA